MSLLPLFWLALLGVCLLLASCLAAAITISRADMSETPVTTIVLAVSVFVVSGLFVMVFPQAVVRIADELSWPKAMVAFKVLLVLFDLSLAGGLWVWYRAFRSRQLDRHLLPSSSFRSRADDDLVHATVPFDR